MQPIDVVRKVWDEIYTQGKTELARQYFADDYVAHDPIQGTMDAAATEADMQRWGRAFPDMKPEILDTVASGDKVVVRWRCSGTHRGEFSGAAATNRKVTIEGITETRVVGGKIKEEWNQFDALGLLRQIGVVPEQAIAGLKPDGGGRATTQQPRR